MISWAIVSSSAPAFFAGLQNTLMLLMMVIASGLLLSIPLGVARASRSLWIAKPVWVFTYVIRGTPLLVQLFVLYYGLAQFDWLRESALWVFFRSPWFCAWAALTINTAAYSTEIFAGAIKAIAPGEVEAARAIGMGRIAVLRHIVWPSAWRRALPQYGNEVVMMLHATALASTVTIVEIMRVARDVYTNYLVLTESFGVAAVIYLFLTVVLAQAFRRLERHYLRHLDRARASEPAFASIQLKAA
ncbi:amino acid ABC transporter permease [Sinorhizobium sp. A49]|uniref:ABC transporter permease n=1 Tax=Sinorhizobium sp. A49 TaxID=1945861 RepID=UPI0009868C14|nr:ABC transporter permease [Sinorhizobium sp. A49]OOG62290.1 amino acid ABC transporter permease [Sinorhizobium sp. A49]